MINSNYAGIYGIRLNPSLTPTSRLYMDFNLIGMQGFIDNDYAYISNKDFFGILFNGDEPVYYTLENEKRSFTINRSSQYKHGFQNLAMTGPSGMVVMGKNAF